MEHTETGWNYIKKQLQDVEGPFRKGRERWIEQEKEQSRQIREVAGQVDTLVTDAAIMQTWRKRVRETVDSARGIKTENDLLAILAEERRNVGAFYTVLACCHDDTFCGGVDPIITHDISSLNPQLFTYGMMYRVCRRCASLLQIYMGRVAKDLGIGKTSQEVQRRPPLSDKAAAVLKLLKGLPEHRGLTGKEILEELDGQGAFLDQSTLTKSIIPALRLYGVKNKRGAGYYMAE